ncbi:ROK family transcriptional regulator [Ruegeria sp. YS9]|uniref:ROK family transcriptional regulator n=1 Tax=Ruegeria sp. YS9 TaxID=2966453 RepID=UPI00214CE7F7|nr:ROK family transcriptional regulator [Ruegeria sp. YS9]UUV08484.1 ROK family transcriptional regulator [Ruegeria sp. YS9]
MRARNERLVLSLVRRHQALAKSELARMTGLSAQTVSVIMRQLEKDGLLLRGEPVRGKVGQPSVPMRLNPDGAFFFGLKVGRRSTELVLTDFVGNVRQRKRRTYDYPTPKATLEFSTQSLGKMMSSMSPEAKGRIAGLGIAMPFYLWDWAQALQVPQEEMDPWRVSDLKADLAGRLDMPVFLQNDATAACGAELVFGPADGPRDFLYFYIGFFIGGGVVLNGAIFSGRGNSGAIGPLPVPDGTGGVRPLIDVASLYVLERAITTAGATSQSLWETTERWDVPNVQLENWLKRTASGIAHAIVSSCSLIDFECVKIDGWMPQDIKARLVEMVEDKLSKLNLTGLERPVVLEGTVGPEARSLGAASLPLSERYLSEA